jgi:hypothetical protein
VETLEWWAHFELTRINTTPIILHKKIEDLRDFGAMLRERLPSSPWFQNLALSAGWPLVSRFRLVDMGRFLGIVRSPAARAHGQRQDRNLRPIT